MTRAFLAGVVLAVGVALPGESLAQGVFVEARETGQGYLRARATECFVLTPFHVVESAAGPIRIVSERAVRATAELLRQLPGDLALLRINDASGLSCAELQLPENFDAQIRGQASGTLTIREADGSQSLMAVMFDSIDDEFIFVRPARAGDQIRKSMSGASLVIAGAPVGLLLSVENGLGRVYQLDDVLRVSDGFFAQPRTVTQSGSTTGLTGCWSYNSLMMTMTADGKVTGFLEGGRWASSGGQQYVITWPRSVDTMTLSADGRALSGTNNYGGPGVVVAGKRAAGDPSSLAGPWQWSNGQPTVFRDDGNVTNGPIPGRWTRLPNNTIRIVWEFAFIDQLTLSPDGKSMSGKNQVGMAVGGTRVPCAPAQP